MEFHGSSIAPKIYRALLKKRFTFPQYQTVKKPAQG